MVATVRCVVEGESEGAAVLERWDEWNTALFNVQHDLHAAVKERGETDRRAHTSQATRLCSLFSCNTFHLSIFTFTKGLPIEFISLILLKSGKGSGKKGSVHGSSRVC